MLRLEEAGLCTAPALDAFSGDVVPGELLAIVGPNGAGKTTLLTLLAGLRLPDSGRLTLDAIDLRDWTPQSLASRRAIVAQRDVPNFAWRVRDLVTLGGTPSVARLERTLESMQLTAFSERVVTELSGGESQRVMIARALCQLAPRPEDATRPMAGGILLLDEPTSALDIGQQQRLMRLLARCARDDGLAIVCVLHDLNLAARYAHRVWLLKAGRRVAAGTPENVLTAERVANAFDAELTLLDTADGGERVLLLDR
ncbi:ATP-binding cassette domain-containing protein [Salinicola lusitanus]|uniref:ATP-binding cassette domain-containing protein n=1 Tax=Salinicola lusitanus TaxID=1949085 RepID=UPI000DA2402A|nr:ATP-binding cassette domain-containing protein [Salinicola lusitanus]